MMDWTTSYCRQFHRQLTRHARLYTEMVTTGALLHGDAPRFLEYAASEQPLALQLGGSEPDDLARAAEMGGRAGYVEINLNCGCPSDRVQEGRFGACLMREPERVAQGVAAMRGATDAVITVKHRVGVDDAEDYPFMRHFVETVAAAGCEVFIVHARKAWLQGLSPKENREVPPLTYEHVYRLKQDFPSLTIVINGGIATLEECSAHLAHVDGVMLGRAPYERPWLLADVDRRLFERPHPVATRDQARAAARRFVATCRSTATGPRAAPCCARRWRRCRPSTPASEPKRRYSRFPISGPHHEPPPAGLTHHFSFCTTPRSHHDPCCRR